MRTCSCVIAVLVACCGSSTAVDPPENLNAWAGTQGQHFIVHQQNRKLDPMPVVRALEAFRSVLTAEFGVEPVEQERVAVYLFGTRHAFEQFLSANDRPKRADGWCHFGDGITFIATNCVDGSAKDPVWATLKHESTHLFLGLNIPDGKQLPMWVNEGLAMYYAHAEVEDDKVKSIRFVPTELYAIQGAIKVGSADGLRQHLARGEEHWDRAKSVQSWSLVYWLMQGDDGKRRAPLKEYLLTAGGAPSPAEHFEKVFGMTIDEAETAWKAFVLGLKVEGNPESKSETGK